MAHCNASVFDSKLLELIVQFKWTENVRARRMQAMVVYGCTCVVAAAAMLVSVTSEDVGTNNFSTADVLQGLLVTIELLSLGSKAFQLVSSAYTPPPCFFLRGHVILSIVIYYCARDLRGALCRLYRHAKA